LGGPWLALPVKPDEFGPGIRFGLLWPPDRDSGGPDSLSSTKDRRSRRFGTIASSQECRRSRRIWREHAPVARLPGVGLSALFFWSSHGFS